MQMIALKDRFAGKVAAFRVAGPARAGYIDYPDMRPFRRPIGWIQGGKT
jgi:hypothetical protein